MGTLSLNMFIGAYRDFEQSQYHVLAGLKKAREAFVGNKVYPTLTELIELYTTLTHITREKETLKQELPKRIKGLDLENNRIIYESQDLGHADFKAVEDLIHWALPSIKKAIEEGKTIYNFVDEHITVSGVGLVPSYIEEGYLLVPELATSTLHVIQYEVTIFSGAGEKYRNLKTATVETFNLSSPGASPWNIKQQLLAEYRQMPNPATWFFDTDLDFPFDHSILPIAKRKLLQKLYS